MSTKSWIWGHWWVYTLAGLTLVLAIGGLVYGTCFAKDPDPNDTIEEPGLPDNSKAGTLSLSLELRLDSWAKPRREAVSAGCLGWVRETKGFVKIAIGDDSLSHLENLLTPCTEIIRTDEGRLALRVMHVTTDEITKYPFLVSTLLKDGFFDAYAAPSCLILMDGPFTDEEVRNIVAHELGHEFGLRHLKPSYPGVMSPGGGEGVITKWDLNQFRFIWGKPKND